MRTTSRRTWALVAGIVMAVLVASAVVLVVRGGSDDSATPGGHQLEKYPVPSVKSLDGNEVKASDVSVSSCDALDDGGQHAMGVVKNAGKKGRDYTITVYFMHGRTAVNYAQTRVTAAPEVAVPWVAEKVFATDDELTCKVVAVS